MASQVIGLDVGTNAVRAVELSLGRGLPVVRRMAQVALPPGAVVAGEVVDAPAVSAALRRLWKEGGFRKRSVVVGVANQRVVARVADLPGLPEDELRSSLRYQVQDLIPIPVDEAQLDFQIIERVQGESGEEHLRVMLVAAHRDMLRSLLAALEGAGLKAERIDAVPFALIRAIYDPSAWLASDEPVGRDEVIVGVGAGVSNVVVHDAGIPRFVRSLPSAGLDVTQAVAAQMGVDVDVAEGLKRGHVEGGTAEDAETMLAIAGGAVDPLVTEIAGSLDFHLAQSEEGGLRRVVVTGGGGRLEALRTGLSEALGIEVVEADAFAQVQLGKVGLGEQVARTNADLFTVAVGLALGSQPLGHDGHRITLLPQEVRARRAERRQATYAGGGLAAFAALLLSLSYVRGAQVDDTRHEAERAEADVAALQTDLAGMRDIETLEADIAGRRTTIESVLARDVDWTGLFNDVTTLLPNDVWLTSFSGTSGDAVNPGTMQVSAKGYDQTSAARWLLRMGDVESLDGIWVPSSQREAGGARELVSFQSNARLTPAAGSDRQARILGEAG